MHRASREACGSGNVSTQGLVEGMCNVAYSTSRYSRPSPFKPIDVALLTLNGKEMPASFLKPAEYTCYAEGAVHTSPAAFNGQNSRIGLQRVAATTLCYLRP